MADNYGISDPTSVDLTNVDDAMMRAITCYLNAGENEYDGRLGARVSALFVILVTSTACTFFPVLATRTSKFKVPLYVYLFARYFGAGVIIATAFIHLLQPGYDAIGPATCVGMTAGWNQYAWPPALALTSAMFTFLLGFAAERYVEKKYGMPHNSGESPLEIENGHHHHHGSVDAAAMKYNTSRRRSTHQGLHSADQDRQMMAPLPTGEHKNASPDESYDDNSIDSAKDKIAHVAFRQQIAAFLILEFGVIFHSVIIGLTLGTAGEEFPSLYPVIVFHQAFEGLGIGARLSAIPFPRKLRWMPWTLCAAYGLTTPIAIAIALGVRTTYNAGSFTASVVSGVLDSTSAGILIYTGFVELIARDFLFNPDRTDDDKQLAFMIVSVLLGAAIMALLGKWA
ncbi:uncharacterized protein LTR77_000887 [Saxophila tyrrhenica]|uniref:Uncharacterized protein n=1 Tax=Saxophila tyrrhenica TaxID=1690608 RepID=A0AAV9PTU8_9PEZI|nr:hypothetical protein LTR77_000887 [Saxophila tyrrhenica]